MATCDRCGRSVGSGELNERYKGSGNGSWTEMICDSCDGRYSNSTSQDTDSDDDDDDDW